NIWAGNFDSKAQLQGFVDENFGQFDDLRLMYGIEDSSFASLANSEIEHIFNEVVDKNANNSFVFQRKELTSQYTLEQAEAESKAVSQPELHYLTTYFYEG
ncbi:MAG: LPS export ABC transporter ATP-binding protein, partial [Chryseobacterium sp.]|nr:LPS export ABC transporter ATP-binding protein [Chryseobacterium sp.]